MANPNPSYKFPKGNQLAKKKRKTGPQIPNKLRTALGELDEEGITLFDKWINKIVTMALGGDKWASDFIADRMEGKPAPIQPEQSDNKLSALVIKYDKPE